MISPYAFIIIGAFAEFVLIWMIAYPLGQANGYHDGYLDATREHSHEAENIVARNRERIGL